ncbi:MAG: hypothetical protein HYW49_08140 [Deltaproteobacteria bacterium]|nr:hypothetical protein [Deltaproteobacteria bacterium]
MSEDEKPDLKSQISEAMKKVVLTGVGTIFLTEETIRNYLGEFKLPKEMWGGFLENAARTKKEFLDLFAKETAAILSRVDFASEARKFFEGQKMRVTIEISFDKRGE